MSDAPRLIPHDPDLEDGTLYLLVDDGDGPVGRRADERDIDLVVAWLREQGAVDVDAAWESKAARRYGLTKGAVHDIVDAAFPVVERMRVPKEEK